MTARRMPMSRTLAARWRKRSPSSLARPNNLTSSAPPMLSVSFMCAFICALRSMPSRAMSRNCRRVCGRSDRRAAGRQMLTRVNLHSSESMTIKIAMASMRLVTMLTMVLLMAFCAPTTSLLRRLINSPTLVLVKKRRHMRCKRTKSATRRS